MIPAVRVNRLQQHAATGVVIQIATCRYNIWTCPTGSADLNVRVCNNVRVVNPHLHASDGNASEQIVCNRGRRYAVVLEYKHVPVGIICRRDAGGYVRRTTSPARVLPPVWHPKARFFLKGECGIVDADFPLIHTRVGVGERPPISVRDIPA